MPPCYYFSSPRVAFATAMTHMNGLLRPRRGEADDWSAERCPRCPENKAWMRMDGRSARRCHPPVINECKKEATETRRLAKSNDLHTKTRASYAACSPPFLPPKRLHTTLGHFVFIPYPQCILLFALQSAARAGTVSAKRS